MSDPTPSQSDAPPQLDYCQRQRLAWIRRQRRLLIFLAVCIAIALPAWWCWQPIRRWALWQYWFRQTVAHQMPQKPVRLITNLPLTADELAVAGHYVQDRNGVYRYAPLPWRQLAVEDARAGSTGSDGGAIAFLGVVRRPDGTPRVVTIPAQSGSVLLGECYIRCAVASVPSILQSTPDPLVLPGTAFSWIDGLHIRLETSGTVDPADPSHIRFDVWLARTAQARPGDDPPGPTHDIASGPAELHLRLRNDDSFDVSLTDAPDAPGLEESKRPLKFRADPAPPW